jgi:transcriptional regulator with XRE-family HTH domain
MHTKEGTRPTSARRKHTKMGISDAKGIGARLRQLRESMGLSRIAMAAELGIHRNYLARCESGQAELGRKLLDGIAAQFPDLDFQWLLTGEGAALRDNSADPEIHGETAALLYSVRLSHRPEDEVAREFFANNPRPIRSEEQERERLRRREAIHRLTNPGEPMPGREGPGSPPTRTGLRIEELQALLEDAEARAALAERRLHDLESLLQHIPEAARLISEMESEETDQPAAAVAALERLLAIKAPANNERPPSKRKRSTPDARRGA